MFKTVEPFAGTTTRAGKRKQRLLTLVVLSLVVVLITGLVGGALGVIPVLGRDDERVYRVEPGAGLWSTWLLKSGDQFRPAAPPNRRSTAQEIRELKRLAGERDQTVLASIAFWNTGAPAYRWNEIAVHETLKHNQGAIIGSRSLALLNAAIYDATIAAWDAKYTYGRPRPGMVDRSLETVVAAPHSPSYPSEHAVTAGAASEVLAYLFPERAGFFREQAQQAGEAFLYAGVQYPSDVEVGLELGRKVAELAIQRAENDSSDAEWDGKIPEGPGYWTGEKPAAVMAGTWQTWVLESGSEFRPEPPPPYNSLELAAEMDELRNYERTPLSNSHALFWEYGAGGSRVHAFWNEQVSKKLFEYDLGSNAPRAARAYALESIAFYDSAVACFDAKYTYWLLRPFQMDADFKPLFATPNHPSYPSAHSCLSGSAAQVMAYLFPRDADSLTAMAEEAGEARIWAGIHYRTDIKVGLELGQMVADKVIQFAMNDGSQE